MARDTREKRARSLRPVELAPAPHSAERAVRRAFVACYAASGAASLIYEVTWTRLLTLNMGHTVAAVTTVLAAFMGGLAAGAWLAGRRPPPRGRSLHTYAALEIAVALIVIGLPFALRAFHPAL